jgi:YbbR domain-containing protein
VSLRAAILENWPYKAAAVTLSVLLWFNVTADQERSDQSVATRLEFVVSDTLWTLREAPTQVVTTFEGRRRDIIALFGQPLIRKVIDGVTDSVMEIELSPTEVVWDRTLNVRPTAVSPSRVTLRFERREERTVAVVPITSVVPADGFVRGRLLIEPESVTVRGGASTLQAIGTLQTERLVIEEADATVTRQLDIRIPPELEGIQIDPERVLLTAEIDSLVERALVVAVRAIGPGAGDVVLSPDSVEVRVRGARRIVAALTPADVQATVRIDEGLTGGQTYRVALDLPPDLAATATAVPPRVTAGPVGMEP